MHHAPSGQCAGSSTTLHRPLSLHKPL